MTLRLKFCRLRTASVFDLVGKQICSLLYKELLVLQVLLQLFCKLSVVATLEVSHAHTVVIPGLNL